MPCCSIQRLCLLFRKSRSEWDETPKPSDDGFVRASCVLGRWAPSTSLTNPTSPRSKKRAIHYPCPKPGRRRGLANRSPTGVQQSVAHVKDVTGRWINQWTIDGIKAWAEYWISTWAYPRGC